MQPDGFHHHGMPAARQMLEAAAAAREPFDDLGGGQSVLLGLTVVNVPPPASAKGRSS